MIPEQLMLYLAYGDTGKNSKTEIPKTQLNSLSKEPIK
jgi:hypothetical protein